MKKPAKRAKAPQSHLTLIGLVAQHAIERETARRGRPLTAQEKTEERNRVWDKHPHLMDIRACDRIEIKVTGPGSRHTLSYDATGTAGIPTCPACLRHLSGPLLEEAK